MLRLENVFVFVFMALAGFLNGVLLRLEIALTYCCGLFVLAAMEPELPAVREAGRR